MQLWDALFKFQSKLTSGYFWLVLLGIIVSVQPDKLLYDKQLSKEVTTLLDTLLKEDRYDKRIRPGFGKGPLKIEVNMYIKNLGPVSETDEVITIDCYFRQRWKESRLKFNLTGLEELSLNWMFLSKIWVPDTYFINGQTSKLHQITVPNKFLRLKKDGLITYSMRLTIKSSCRMFLKKFPLDTQRCNLDVGSYGYNTDDVTYSWVTEGPIEIEEGVHLAQYDLVNTITKQETRISNRQDEISVIIVQFALARHKGYFLLQIFMPASLIVLSSWVTFWIDPQAVPARVSLGVTTVLSMTTLGFGGRAQLPRTSYATALDWFVIICFAFVFASLIEYAGINFMDKMIKDIANKAKAKKQKQSDSTEEMAVQDTQLKGDTGLLQWLCRNKKRVQSWFQRQLHDPWKASSPSAGKFSKVDIYSRKVFPIAFLLINIIYWVSFLYYEVDEY